MELALFIGVGVIVVVLVLVLMFEEEPSITRPVIARALGIIAIVGLLVIGAILVTDRIVA